jgi:excisionase family DNA binding protein
MAATMSEPAEMREGLTTVEAAARLGISKEMVRKRIRQGRLWAVRVQTSTGWAYRVSLPGTEAGAFEGMAGAMSDDFQADPRVSTAEAARQLGVTVAKVRSMIRDGALHADRVRSRRNTMAYLVTLPAVAGPGAGELPSASSAVDLLPAPARPPVREEDSEAMDTSTPVPATPSAPSSQNIADVIQASITPLVAPLKAAIDGYRQANERHVEQLVEQAERLGRLQAENAVLRTSQPPPVRRGAPKSTTSGRMRSTATPAPAQDG